MYKHFLKRALDLLFSLILLPIVLIFILLIGFFIYLFDGGPIFYASFRMGKDGRIFKMYKFRSMKQNSSDLRNSDGSAYNGDNDPRVTKIGNFLRKTSIDEIPQILNVLLGDMSIVGPRPSLTTTPYDQYDKIRKKRVSVKPGITGYSQAFYRNSISQQQKFILDCEYVDRVSFFFDLKILFKTISSVLKRKNIYNE